MALASGRKPHIALVGHLAGSELYGAERSLLDILASIDRDRYDVSCVLPEANDRYLALIAKHAGEIGVFPYRWRSAARPVDEEAVSRFTDFFASRGIDLVHVNTVTLMEPLIAARRAGIPCVVHVREIVTADDDLIKLLGDGRLDASAIVSGLLAETDFVIANSDATHQLFYKEARSFRLYNMVDLDALDIPNERIGDRLSVGIISSNTPKKGNWRVRGLGQAFVAPRRPGILGHRFAQPLCGAARTRCA